MKLARFEYGDQVALGAVVGDRVVDLRDCLGADAADAVDYLTAEPAARRAAEELAGSAESGHRLDEVRLLAPVRRPPKFLAIGLNYADHIAESGQEVPKSPLVFNKQTSCVTGPVADIELPVASNQLDYEGELGVVIGRRGRHVPRDRAKEVIGGYLVIDDVSVRDWQLAQPTWTMGKSWDTHGPIGPWLTTPDEIDDAGDLDLRTWVNGELRQSSNTKNLVFGPELLVEHLSTVFTLEPGDIIATGTPGGVGFGMSPPRPLVPGDVVKVEIQGLGAIENTVVGEGDDSPRIG